MWAWGLFYSKWKLLLSVMMTKVIVFELIVEIHEIIGEN